MITVEHPAFIARRRAYTRLMCARLPDRPAARATLERATAELHAAIRACGGEAHPDVIAAVTPILAQPVSP